MRRSRPVFSLTILVLFASLSSAETLAEAARRLADRITPREPATFSVRNLSSLSPSEAAEVRQALVEALRSKVVEGSEEAQVRVTLSENSQGYLWVAEMGRGEERRVVMVAPSRPQAAARRGPVATVAIEKSPIWEQEAPILDVAMLADGKEFLVLDPQQVTRSQPGGVNRGSVAIPSARPWPRDPRGRLSVYGDSFRAYLPGMTCQGAVRPALTMDCRDSDDPWPLYAGSRLFGYGRLAPGRNFFEGRVVTTSGAARELPSFYSFAGDGERWIFVDLNGQARLYNGVLEPAGTFGAAGSDLAAIESRCGRRWQVLVTRASDAGEPDAVQAYEIVEGQGVAVSQPVDFPGPVTALWPAAGGASAVAASHNPKTNKYEAFRLAISCGR